MNEGQIGCVLGDFNAVKGISMTRDCGSVVKTRAVEGRGIGVCHLGTVVVWSLIPFAGPQAAHASAWK